jgi:hypothetical protein
VWRGVAIGAGIWGVWATAMVVVLTVVATVLVVVLAIFTVMFVSLRTFAR